MRTVPASALDESQTLPGLTITDENKSVKTRLHPFPKVLLL